MGTVETVVETIQKTFPWLVGLPLLPKIIFSLIVLLSAMFLLALMWSTPERAVPFSRPDSSELLRKKLVEQLRELDFIEAKWEERYGSVESLAHSMASVLKKDHPESAVAISEATEAPTARQIARVMRNEARKVIDQLDITPSR
jgi:hypothetical protein